MYDTSINHPAPSYPRVWCKLGAAANECPWFGKKALNEIIRDDVKQLAYHLLRSPKANRRKKESPLTGEGSSVLLEQPPKRSRSYVRAILAPLSEMFNHAIEDGHYHGVNPVLRVLRRNRMETLRNGWREPPEWVFLTPTRTRKKMGDSGNETATMTDSGEVIRIPGNRIDPDNFRKRVWPRILAKAGLPMIRPHALRHTFASLLIGQGESLAYIKEQMGHHSIRVTVDTYGHLVPGGNRAAVDRLDALLAQPTATQPQPAAVIAPTSAAK